MTQAELERGVGEVLIDEETLQARVVELGGEISADYGGRDLLLVGVLKGAVFFMADLMRELTVPCEIDVPVRYVGFEIPNRFVIGYGLDFAERYRNLPYVAVLHADLVPNTGSGLASSH